MDAETRLAPDGAEIAECPRHVAIIMDGNGRWAAARGLPRGEGHRRGVEALRRVVRGAGELGVRYLTIFSFSSENWSRPAQEIGDLFGLLRRFIRNDLAELHRDGVRVRIIGERDRARARHHFAVDRGRGADPQQHADDADRRVQLRLAPGDRPRRAAARRRTSPPASSIRRRLPPTHIEARLDTAGIPDPDLIIRTSGEQRLSNFLMWQAAYSELVFVPVHWPDFDKAALRGAIDEYSRRERRFGGLIAKTGS